MMKRLKGFKQAKLATVKRWVAKRDLRLLQQVIPSEELDPPFEASPPPQGGQSSKYVRRPGFSIPLMTSNFRRFNAR